MMKKTAAVFILLLLTLSANAEVISAYQMKNEPAGLYAAKLRIGGDPNRVMNYRVYCPKSLVRNVSGKQWGVLRNVYEEDRLYHGDMGFLVQDFNRICQKQTTLLYENCSHARTVYEMRECNEQRMSYYDSLVNKAYLNAISKRSISDQKSIKSSQYEWMAERKRRCGDKTEEMRKGTEAALRYGNCKVEMSKRRIGELKRY